jgi:CTD nuclear envelope phosphatase 1
VDKEKPQDDEEAPENLPMVWSADASSDEKTPLLDNDDEDGFDSKPSSWMLLPSRITSVFIYSIKWVFTTLASPGIYLIACLYDDGGRFTPLRKFGTPWPNKAMKRTEATAAIGAYGVSRFSSRDKDVTGRRSLVKSKPQPISNSSSSGLSSESESERERSISESDTQELTLPSRHTRSKSLQATDEIAPARRSIRIKLHNEDSLRQRKHRKSLSTSSQSNGSGAVSGVEALSAAIKSPTSPASSSLSLTKYPRAPAPPRPLIPRRQPSYSLESPNGRLAQKTLILDLDETLIHSMAKGGRMSSGHMVEVKLNTYIGVPGQTTAGPQHPILYYVHKRPHCDDFLRRVRKPMSPTRCRANVLSCFQVCKWYNLVIFTASVQEYADPVIDWLEQERKFFSGRFYRQHCTYRHGAFIKDLSSVEPDLSKVMILDNSPLSYMFHQGRSEIILLLKIYVHLTQRKDNAIPIEGWINDPTDNDLLHLVPLLEGLQYVTDVRALLALRGGEDGKHMTT